MSRILGIDPGSRLTGFGVIETTATGYQYIASGCLRIKGDEFPLRLKQIFAGISDIVGFHGAAVSELRTAFEEAVNDYLETCKKTSKQPQKPYSGKLMLRIPPKVHAAVAIAAEVSGKSINQWAADMLDKAAHSH